MFRYIIPENILNFTDKLLKQYKGSINEKIHGTLDYFLSFYSEAKNTMKSSARKIEVITKPQNIRSEIELTLSIIMRCHIAGQHFCGRIIRHNKKTIREQFT